MQKGEISENVKVLQDALNEIGFNCGLVDGYFGFKTENAVKQYQASKKLIMSGVADPQLLEMAVEDAKTRRISKIKAVLAKKGHSFFDMGDYNLNVIAVREDDVFDNRFSDTLHLIFKADGQWQAEKLKWTTLAGTLGFGGEQNPLDGNQTGTGVSGVAIILEGQYRGAFKWVENGWQYPFTTYGMQVKPLKYLRDDDRNGIVTRNGKVYEGIYQTHLHAMSAEGTDSDQVNYPGQYGAWSQGCQGTPSIHFEKFKRIIRQSVKIWGDRFTYTILKRNDFIQ